VLVEVVRYILAADDAVADATAFFAYPGRWRFVVLSRCQGFLRAIGIAPSSRRRKNDT